MAADSTITIRALQLQDVGEVERLHKYATHQGKPVFPQYGDDAARVLQAAAAEVEGCFGVVALLAEPAEPGEAEVVGAGTAQLHSSSSSSSSSQHTPEPDSQQQACELVLLTLAVRADVRQQGLGSRLLEALVQQAHQQACQREAGCLQRVVTDIGLRNQAAWQFFQRAGFTRGPAAGSTTEAVLTLTPHQPGSNSSHSSSRTCCNTTAAAVARSCCIAPPWQPRIRGWHAVPRPPPVRALLRGCPRQQALHLAGAQL